MFRRQHGSFRLLDFTQQADKLVTTEVRTAVGLSGTESQPPRDFDQQLVSGFMPVRIVDHLETVQVDIEQPNTAPEPSIPWPRPGGCTDW